MTNKIRYKVLGKDHKGPYQNFCYEIGKWYEEPRIGEHGNANCLRGLYAVPIEGLLYRGVWRPNETVFRCEVKGRGVGEAPYKTCWEKLKIVEEVSTEEVRRLARHQHNRIGYRLEEALYPLHPLRIDRGAPTETEIETLRYWDLVRT